MTIQFQENYDILELEHGADWKHATKNYRRLVHIWHPDKFENRPREREHAQKQFIELTKAFNNLRAYYRQFNRLPYERLSHAVHDDPVPPAHQRVSLDDPSALEDGILNKQKYSSSKVMIKRFKPLLWVVPVGMTLCAAMVAFFIVDRNDKMRMTEDAKRVLRNARPSEFMPDKETISHVNNRAVMLHRNNSNTKLGDKLAKDLFK